MEFNEIEVLRKQIQILIDRVSAVEAENSKHIAMLQILAETKASENVTDSGEHHGM